jgi:hypothetical protein
MKTRIVEQLGETAVLMPARIAEGLAANDRAKARMSALQAVAKQAAHPGHEPDDLSAECTAAGIDASEIQAILGGARAGAPGVVMAPGLARLIHALFADIDAMIAAARAGDQAASAAATKRLSSLKALSAAPQDEIESSRLSALSALPADGDSVHRLVMDVHKVLNRLSAACAEESVAGAHAHGVLPGDRPMIEAFMRGIDRTRGLKFDHPGLDTTAIRSGSRLIIQNDIGATDAHVLVVTVEGLNTTVTYTDIHHARAKFFMAQLDRFAVDWTGLDQKTATGLSEGTFFLVTGRHQAGTEEHRNAFLEAIGTSIVFLIDWNKARKSLRTLIDGQSAVRVLDWAARHEIGHRAYLECGGADLVAAAVRHAASSRIGFGEQLAAVLGHDIALDFLKAVLRISMEGLRDGRSSRLVRDAIESELVRHLDRGNSAMLAIVLRQVALARDIAIAIADHIAVRADGSAPREGIAGESALVARARRIEEKADRIAVDARAAVQRLSASPTIAQLVDTAEATVDDLEEAAFVASLAPAVLDPAFVGPLTALVDAVVSGTEVAVSGIDAAAEVSYGRRADVDDAFDATRRLIDLEHAADDSERIVTGLVLGNDGAGGALCLLELARAIERATDRLARIGHLVHEHVMADLSA